MKGDFTRITHDPKKHYTRVLKQQGRVDVDADWNEFAEIFTHLERAEAVDVIGRCGVSERDGGFKVEATNGGTGLTISPGRLYVDGIQCSLEGDESVSIEDQPDLPDYDPPDENGVYIAYADVWERHITYIEDPDIREIALGGPDTATRVQTICQVKLHKIADDGEIEDFECVPYPAKPNTGRLAAKTEADDTASKPCVVGEKGGYRGIDNRLYRIEVHDRGKRNLASEWVHPPTFTWSRDNASVVLPIESIDAADQVTVKRLGFDDVLTVKGQHWVEISGDHTELSGSAGTLAKVGQDPNGLKISLTQIVGNLIGHQDESHLKLRRWDHTETDDAPLRNGAVPIQGDWYELEDGVKVKFDLDASYDVGDYWVIPARTREGDVLWPQDGADPAALPRLGVEHHYCTLALVRRNGGHWEEPRDCRPTFPPLTEVDDGACCLKVDPGREDQQAVIQQAIDTIVADGGGSICLCHGVHEVVGPIWLHDARNVRIRGEGPGTVLLLSADDNGSGGLMIESGERVTIESMFIASNDVAALITVRHNSDDELNRTLAFRRLTMLNCANSDGQTSLPCGIRLAHTEGVAIDECRIAAEVGVVSLWGNRLLDLGETEDDNGGSTHVAVNFDNLTVNEKYRVGDTFTDSGVMVTGGTFYWGNGQSTDNGFARVEDGGRAGGSGNELQVNNINLNFAIDTAYTSARVDFGDFGGNTNLRVNGVLRNTGGLAQLDGDTIGGVSVSVESIPGSDQSVLVLDADTAEIKELAIGGQELWIDNVIMSGGGGEPPPVPEPKIGHGVTALRMDRTKIRYGEYGVFSCRSEGWSVERCEIHSLEETRWMAAADHLSQAVGQNGQLPRFAPVQAAVEDLFADVNSPGGGMAIAAFLWRDSAVRESSISGAHGVHAWWWIRGTAEANKVSATETGLFAMWLHAADWRENRVTCSDGAAMCFSGCHRAGIEANRLHGGVGITNVPFGTALDTLAVFAAAVTRGYDASGDEATLAAFQYFLVEIIDLLGLRELSDTIQHWLAANSVVTTSLSAIIAGHLRGLVGDQSKGGVTGITLPVIHLRIVGNDVTAGRQCVAVDDFIPLGSISLLRNRLHTISGQAVRLEADGLAANAHLVVFLFRALLNLLRDGIEEALAGAEEGDEDELKAVLKVLSELLERWQEDSETFLELDFRIESNTIRSLLTAIEFNLFELAVLDNHITLQERLIRGAEVAATGSLFGTVVGVDNRIVEGVVVRVTADDFDELDTTDETGTYRIDGVPAGTFTVRASRSGYRQKSDEVHLAGGEQIKRDYKLDSWHFRDVGVMGVRELTYGDTVMAKRRNIRAGSNLKIDEIALTLEGSEATEPLAMAIRNGAYVDERNYTDYMSSEDGPLNTEDARNTAAAAIDEVSGLASDPETVRLGRDLGDALRVNDKVLLKALLPKFIQAVQGLVDSQGILARGIGCRIVGNQVLVPADVRPETQALGGIQISVSFLDLFVAALIGNLLLEAISGKEGDPGRVADPLLGVTDTLIENNEVLGGVGHGVSVQGSAGFPDALGDLRIRNNQVRGVGGAGIFSNEHAYLVGVEITGNHVAECSRSVGFSEAKGGIVVHTAAACHVNGNHIERCGDAKGKMHAFGIDMDTVYGLQLTDNVILANGPEASATDGGGARLVETYGAVALNDNVVSFNRGAALTWVNTARNQDPPLLPAPLLTLANLYFRSSRNVEALADEGQATVQNNVMKSEDQGVTLFNLLNVTNLIFSGNTCFSESGGVPLGEIKSVNRGVISNNLLRAAGDRAISIKKMKSGVIIGNVGDKPSEAKFITDVEVGFNVPPIET